MKDFLLFEYKGLKLSFAWYDLWIGAYIDTKNKRLYICIIPTILITIDLSKTKKINTYN